MKLAETNDENNPVVLQLFGRDSKVLVETVKKLEKDFDIIDLNCGCPS